MANLEQVENCVRKCFGNRLTSDQLSTPISELDLDSLDFMEFVMTVEDAFDVEIDADVLDFERGIDQFVDLIPAKSET